MQSALRVGGYHPNRWTTATDRVTHIWRVTWIHQPGRVLPHNLNRVDFCEGDNQALEKRVCLCLIIMFFFSFIVFFRNPWFSMIKQDPTIELKSSDL